MTQIKEQPEEDDYFDGLCANSDEYDIKYSDKEHSDVHSIKKTRVEQKEEPKEYEPIVALGDLEGNATALIYALIKVGYIEKKTFPDGTKQAVVTETGKNKKVVQTGDVFDRGKFPLKTQKRIQAMRHQGLNFITVAGNHDVHNLHLASCPSVVNDDPKFYKFISDSTPYITSFNDAKKRMDAIHQLIEYNQTEEPQQFLCDAHAYLIWRFTDPNVSDNNGLLKEIQAQYFCDNTEEPTIREFLQKMHQLYYGNEEKPGEMQNFTDNIVPFYSQWPVFFLHGGIDDTWAELIEQLGIEGAISFFQKQVKNGDLFEFYHPEGKYGKLFWARGKKVLSKKAVDVLKKLGYTTIIRGHDPQKDNLHSVQNIDGITIVNNDVGLSHGNIAGIVVNNLGKIIGFNPSDKQTIKILGQLPTISQRVNNIIGDDDEETLNQRHIA